MARDHVEVAHLDELPPETGELVAGLSDADYRTLSFDTDDGGFTRYVSIQAGWGGGPVTLDRPHEVYLVDGELAVGDHSIGAGGYVRIPSNVEVTIEAPADVRGLWMTGIGAEDQGVTDGDDDTEVLVRDAATMEWEETFVPGPDPGLYIKLLWEDERTGAYTRLIRAEEGWSEDRVEHHGCVEEIYTLEGHAAAHDTDDLTTDTYLWRPPRVRHGPYEAEEETTFFIRTDSELVNNYTSKDGEPLNYEGPPPEATAADGRSRPRTGEQT